MIAIVQSKIATIKRANEYLHQFDKTKRVTIRRLVGYLISSAVQAAQ